MTSRDLDRWKRELAVRRREATARAQVRVANRTFKRRPGRLDSLAVAMLRRMAGSPGPPDPELEHPSTLPG